MVRALLAGTKTQTRRVLNPQPAHLQVYDWKGKRLHDSEYRHWCWKGHVGADNWDDITRQLSPFLPHAVGDRLYVREEIEAMSAGPGYKKYLLYSADAKPSFDHSWPAEWQRDKARPMHMFKRFSRMTLPVTGVRVEQLHDITQAGTIAEGIERIPYEGKIPDHVGQFGWKDYRKDHPHSVVPYHDENAVLSYRSLWESINGVGSWDTNPWVCVTSWSHVIHQNIDKVKP